MIFGLKVKVYLGHIWPKNLEDFQGIILDNEERLAF